MTRKISQSGLDKFVSSEVNDAKENFKCLCDAWMEDECDSSRSQKYKKLTKLLNKIQVDMTKRVQLAPRLELSGEHITKLHADMETFIISILLERIVEISEEALMLNVEMSHNVDEYDEFTCEIKDLLKDLVCIHQLATGAILDGVKEAYNKAYVDLDTFLHLVGSNHGMF